MKRVVLDTNIIISSALGGALEMILDHWAEQAFTVVVTSDILSEYFDILNRPKFRLEQVTIDRITRYIYQFAEFVIPEERFQVIKTDPGDDKFLDAAIAGKAEYIVSCDNHLLELRHFQNIPIISAREFMDWLAKNK